MVHIFVDEIDSSLVNQQVCVYGMLVTYKSINAAFCYAYLTDFTESTAFGSKIYLEINEFPIKGLAGSLNSSQLLPVDFGIRKMRELIKQISREVQEELPAPTARPNDDVFKHGFIVEATGWLKLYNDILDFKNANIKVLSRKYVEDHVDDEHLRDLLKNMKNKIIDLEEIDERYGLSDLIAPQASSVPPNNTLLETYEQRETQREPPPRLDGDGAMYRVTQRASLGTTKLENGAEFERDLDLYKELAADTESELGSQTDIDKILDDDTLAGTHKIHNVTVVGYLCADRQSNQGVTIDNLELVLEKHGRALRVRFETAEEALEVLDLDSIEDLEDETALKQVVGREANARITKVVSGVTESPDSPSWPFEYWALRKLEM